MSTVEHHEATGLHPGINAGPFRQLPEQFRTIILDCYGDGKRMEQRLREAAEAIGVPDERRRVTLAIWASLGITPPPDYDER